MTITLEELKQKYTELGAMIKSFEKQQEEAEFPKDGDEVYYMNACGHILLKTNFREGYDNDMLAIGNCFRTKEEAEDVVRKLKIIAEVKKNGGFPVSSWQRDSDGEFVNFKFEIKVKK